MAARTERKRAWFHIEWGGWIYRVAGDTVEKVKISVGLRDKDYTQVMAGLQKGDELVIDYDQEGMEFAAGQGGPFGR